MYESVLEKRPKKERRGDTSKGERWNYTLETGMSDSIPCPCAGGPMSCRKLMRSEEGMRLKRLVLPAQAVLSRCV